MPNGRLWKFLVLWLATLVIAYLVLVCVSVPDLSVPFWIATSSLPALDGGSVPVPSWSPIPLREIWYFLVLSIAWGTTLAQILTIIAKSVIARNWNRAGAWLIGLLSVGFLAYFISLLAYRTGPWQNVGLWVLYGTRGPLGPTLVFATAIIVARLLSNAAQSNAGKNAFFLALSGLALTSVLTMFVTVPFMPGPNGDPYHAVWVSLLVLDGLMYVGLALLVIFALAKIAIVAARRTRT
jgi:hypothetical protein